MYYQLHDSITEDELGIIKVTNATECWKKEIDHSIEVSESWDEFNRCEESEFDPEDVDSFVLWHNENRVSQIERITVEFCQPHND